MLGLTDGPAPDAAHRGEPDAQQSLETSERERLVRAATALLPERFRLPLLLRFEQEMGYDDIAAAIGRTASAARSRVHYGLKRLAELLPPEVLP